jgi:hypothetical protein
VILLLACATPDAPAPDDTDTVATTTAPDPDTVPLEGACPSDSDLGGFVVEAADGYTIVDGTVRDGVVPSTVLTESARDGDCVLSIRQNPHCDPACGSDETCDVDGTCIPYPSTVDLGTVRVDGLVEPVEMEPAEPGDHYFDTRLPHPGFDAGALVTLSSDTLDLYAVGVDLLVARTDTLALEGGVDLDVAWDPPVGTDRAEVVLSVNVDQHGLSPAQLVCTFADTGAGTVPGGLVQALLDAGVSGFPSATLRRRTADSTDGCVDFEVASVVSLDVEVR